MNRRKRTGVRVKNVARVASVCLFVFSAAFLCAQGTPPAVGLEVGKTAPDFSVKMTDGSAATLSGLRGAPVLLHFWATWCPPCVRELPLIVDVASTRADDITVLAVSVGENRTTVSTYLTKKGPAFSSFASGYDDDASVSALYRISAVPTTLFIDSRGVITKIHVGAYSESALKADVDAAVE